MNWDDLAGRLAAAHQDNPQRARLAELGLAKIREGVGELAALGHSLHLEEGAPPAPLEWPKMVYHSNCREGRVVGCQAELEELGQGWHDHPAKVDQAEGMAAQFEGRGGVTRTGGALVPVGEPTELDQQQQHEGASPAGGEGPANDQT